jgi:hypothetical protein
MKTCSYCGKEYSDDAEVCAIDQQPLKEPAESSSSVLVRHSMKKPVKIAIIVFVLVLELVWWAWPRFYMHGIVLDEPYRNAERKMALYANLKEKTLKTKAAYDAEVKLLDEHLAKKWLGILAVVLAIDAVGFYYFWRYASTKTTA